MDSGPFGHAVQNPEGTEAEGTWREDRLGMIAPGSYRKPGLENTVASSDAADRSYI